MSRLDDLRHMRDFIDQEIAGALGPHAHDLIQRAADLYEVPLPELLGRGRNRRTAAARHGAAWLLFRTGMSWRDVGTALGLDHSTVGYAIRKVEAAPHVRALLVGLEVVV
jgi:chromosomal replication initiation ATPase DnaA